MNTTKQNVVDSFDATFQEKYILPEGLISQWLIDANGEFSNEIYKLNYDINTGEYDALLDQYVIKTIAYIMKKYYLERERSRINKLSNIRTRELTLDGSGDAKRAVKSEYNDVLSEINLRFHKLKTTSYAN